MKQTPPLSQLRIDPEGRPHAPALPNVTEEQRTKGRRLAAIHRHHLMELARLRSVMQAIETGARDPSSLPNLVLGLDMTRNFRAFGNLCGRECQMLAFHHNAEEQMMFPELEAKAGEGIAAVIARLREEHEVVHALIERLYAAAVALMQEPGEATFTEARATFEALEAAVASHFGYEETELRDAIGVHLDLF